MALYSPKDDTTTYGYYFLFFVSSAAPSIDLGEIPENRGNISRRETRNAREVMRILHLVLSRDFPPFDISLGRPLRMDL
jgi:hypothetical protein